MAIKLFQYWNNPVPPPEVAGWIAGFRDRNPDFEHRLFDEESAAGFIRERFGTREEAAFRACAVPAMQADYIRLCALLVHGGVWVDADNQSLRPLAELIARAPRSMVFSYLGLINNGFLWFREPGDAFLRACLALTIENIEARRFTTEFTSTGPGVFNAIRVLLDPASMPEVLKAFGNEVMGSWGFDELLEIARASVAITPTLSEAFNAITVIPAMAGSAWIGADQPEYKKTGIHWLNWTGPIYRS